MRPFRGGARRRPSLKDLPGNVVTPSLSGTPMESSSKPPFGGIPAPMQTAPVEDAAVRTYDLIGRRDERERRRLYVTCLAAVIAAATYFGLTADVEDPLHRYLGLVIFGLSLWPALEWVKQGGNRFPVFEPMMALCANAYGVPLMQGHQLFAQYPPESVTLAALAVIAYLVGAILSYQVTSGRPARGQFWTESILNQRAERYVSYGLVLSTVYTGLAAFTQAIPDDIESVLRAVFSGVSILCTFITCQRWGRGEITSTERWLFGSMIVAQLLIQATGLMLIGSISLIGIAILGYLSAGRSLPMVPVTVTFALVAILHNGKSTMRDEYWEDNVRRRPEVSQLPGFFADWVTVGLNPPVSERRGELEDERSASARLLDRASLMHILTMIVHYTPDRQPYLNGETYGYVLPQLIPRLLWPEKPPSHVGTNRLSVYYGLQSEDATTNTTIAFGMPAEAYANFGLFGMVGLGVFFGVALKKFQVLSAHSPMFSLAGITMILLTAWSLNAEFTMAVWISSLFQAMIVALGIPLILRGVLGD
jgi:hypothetical protein